jgi:hypothetical protein
LVEILINRMNGPMIALETILLHVAVLVFSIERGL